MTETVFGKVSVKQLSFTVAVFSCVSYVVIYRVWKSEVMTEADRAQDLFRRFWDWRVKESPEFGTCIGNHTYDDKLESYAVSAFEERKKACQSFLDEANGLLLSSGMDYASRENLKLFIAELNTFVNGLDAKGYLFPVNRLEGVHIELSRLVSVMVYKTEDDYKKLISRLKLVPIQINEIIELMQEGIKLKMTNHEVSMNAVLNQLDQLETDVEESPFYKPALTMPTEIDSVTRNEIARELKEVIAGHVLPAFRKLKKFLETEYFKHLRPHVGVSTLPNGTNFYRMCLQFHLGFGISPEDVHEMGLKEVKRIEQEMMKVIKRAGKEMSVQNFSKSLQENKDFFCKSEDEIVNEYKNIVFNKIRPKLPSIIKTIPQLELSIEPSPPSMHSGPSAYYLGGTRNGRPGVFYINTGRLQSNPKYDMMTLSLHEAEPGHHLQWSYVIEQEGVPEFRQYVEDRRYSDAPSRFPLHTSYLEGWGLYCEYLGYELGLYEDPYVEFGHLSYEMFRACRLVVDTGMHVFGWDREKAVNFMLEKTAMGRKEIENEIDRYITWPGQACAYKVGELKIKELRSKAAKALGSKFSIQDFHDVVLRSAGPLSLLEQNVEEYIKQHSIA